MNAIVRNILGRAERWPEEDQEELAQLALAIELRRSGPHRVPTADLEAIDEAIASLARGERASDADIAELLAKHRGA